MVFEQQREEIVRWWGSKCWKDFGANSRRGKMYPMQVKTEK